MRADAVTVIEEDQRLLESLFERLQAGTGEIDAHWCGVAAPLTTRARAEEQQVYPVIDKAAPEARRGSSMLTMSTTRPNICCAR